MKVPSLGQGRAEGLPVSGHVPALDGLRGLAILIVMLGHCMASVHGTCRVTFVIRQCTDAGWIGVDLFFVLSGFLITGILFDAKGDRHYFRNFYGRRTLRIFPLYYGVLLLTCVLLPMLLGHPLVRRQGWLWAYAQNIYPLVRDRPFSLPNQLGFQFSHFWSLAVEEHFYLVWPFVVFLADRKRVMRIATGVMAMALALRIVFLVQGAPWELLYKTTFLRMDALAAGAWVAMAARGPGGLAALVRPARDWAVAGGLAVGVLFLRGKGLDRDDDLIESFGYTFIAVLWASVLVLVLAAPKALLVRGGLEAGWLQWLGRYSYGLYVLHGLLRPWFNRFAPIPKRPTVVDWPYVVSLGRHLFLAFAVSLALAWLSYHLFEKRFLKLKRYFEPDRRPGAAAVAPPLLTVPSLSLRTS